MAQDYGATLKALDAVGGRSGECPVCGGQLWAPGKAPQLLPVLDDVEHPIDKEGHFTLQGAEVVSVACRGCGFLRLFHASLLLKN